MKMIRGLAVGLFAVAALSVSEAAPQGPQCFGMACCPPGQAARGIDRSSHALQCTAMREASQDCFVDYRTQRDGMHACPAGTYVRGLHENDNLLTCCFDRERGYTEFAAGEHKDQQAGGAVHDCAAPGVLTGFHGTGELLCSQPRAPSPIADPVRLNLDPEASRSYEPSQPLEAWRRATHNWIARMLELPPGDEIPPAPAMTVQGVKTVGDGFVQVTRKHVRYPSAWREGGEIPAFLFLPSGYHAGGSYPAVLVQHGHPVDGPEGKEGTAVKWRAIYHAVALYLAQNGFVALAPDTRTFGEFERGHDDGSADWRHRKDLPRRYLRDNMTSVSALLSVPGVRAESLGMAGLSLGGYQTMMTTSMDPRIRGAVVSGLYIDLQDITGCQHIEGLQNRHGTGLVLHTKDLTKLMAPRPLEVTFGTDDASFYHIFVNEHQADSAHEVYDRLFKDPGNLRVNVISHFAHEFDGLSTVSFLREHLVAGADRPGEPVKIDSLHCPPGTAMIGAHLVKHDAVCQAVTPAGAMGGATCLVDERTQRGGMHACPVGMYVRGIDDDTKRLTCCPGAAGQRPIQKEAPDALLPQSQDDATQSQGMHVCPSISNDGSRSLTQTVMTGIDGGQDRFLCAH